MFDTKDFVETMMSKMREILESGQDAIPMAFKVGTDGEVLPIGIAGMKGEREKDGVSRMLQQLADQPDTACVVFLCDSYIKTVERGEEIVARLKDVPGRREAISVTVSGRGIASSWATWAYDRDAAGKPVFEEKIRWTEHAEGRFAAESGPTPRKN